MDGNALRRLVDSNDVVKRNFGGILPADGLDNKTTSNSEQRFYIVNTDPSNLPGSHWVAFGIGERVEFFDSLGRAPNYYYDNFERFLIERGPSYTYNKTRYQSSESESCGEFCLYYIALRTVDVSYETIVNSFRENVSLNDVLVHDFVSDVFATTS